MAPSLNTETAPDVDRISRLKAAVIPNSNRHGGNTLSKPLKSSGSLDQFESHDATLIIGTEFPNLQIVDLLNADNSEQLIRDLAILVAQRGVVFFRDQDITLDQQKRLGTLLGELTGKPSTSKLHVHPTTWKSSELGDEITVIDSKETAFNAQFYGRRSELTSNGWHADITFEQVPSDYAILKIHTLPKTGGDTLWASACEVYDRLSVPYQKFLEGLTAYHSGARLKLQAQAVQEQIQTNRGSPDNQGPELDSIHPVVRTNPVTGWKSVFLSNNFTQYISELKFDESRDVITHVNKLISQNHDLQVRFKWRKNDVAIWDNRSVFHTGTTDVIGDRLGDRVVSLGERPYFDPNSKSRREDLGLPIRVP